MTILKRLDCGHFAHHSEDYVDGGDIQVRFDSEELVRAVKEIATKQGPQGARYWRALLRLSAKCMFLPLPRLIRRLTSSITIDPCVRQANRPTKPCALPATSRRVAAVIFSIRQRYGKPSVQHQRPLSPAIPRSGDRASVLLHPPLLRPHPLEWYSHTPLDWCSHTQCSGTTCLPGMPMPS